MKIDTLAEEAARIARRLRNAAEMMEAETDELASSVDRQKTRDYVAAIRGLADQLAQAAAQIPWPQAQPHSTATLTPSHLLSVLHEAAVTLEGDQLALLALGAALANRAPTADDAHALDQIRDHLHDAARVLVTTATIAAKGLPITSPLLPGDPPMVRMSAEAFARVMAHLYVVQEWLGASLPEGTPESDRVRASLKRSIEIMRTGREQTDEPPASITLEPFDPPTGPDINALGMVMAEWASHTQAPWLLRFRVHERDAEPDRAAATRERAEALARFAGVEDYVFVMAGNIVHLSGVRGDQMQIWKIAIFAREQYGWVMQEP